MPQIGCRRQFSAMIGTSGQDLDSKVSMSERGNILVGFAPQMDVRSFQDFAETDFLLPFLREMPRCKWLLTASELGFTWWRRSWA